MRLKSFRWAALFVACCSLQPVVAQEANDAQDALVQDAQERDRAMVYIERKEKTCQSGDDQCWKFAGSGFFSTPDGDWILTAAHITDPANPQDFDDHLSPKLYEFRVKIDPDATDGKKVKYYTSDVRTDLACLYFHRAPSDPMLSYISLGDSTAIKEKAELQVVGFPGGKRLDHTDVILDTKYPDLDHAGKWQVRVKTSSGIDVGVSGGPIIEPASGNAIAIFSEGGPINASYFGAPLIGLGNASPCLMSAPHPNRVNAFIQRGTASFNQHDYARATGYFEQALRSDSNNWEALFGLARIAFVTKRYDDALKLYQKIATIKPDDVSILYQETICFDALGRYDDALDLLEKIIQRADPKLDTYKSAIFDQGLLNLVKAQDQSRTDRQQLLNSAHAKFEDYNKLANEQELQWSQYSLACIAATQANNAGQIDNKLAKQAVEQFATAINTIKAVKASDGGDVQRSILHSLVAGNYVRSPGGPVSCTALVRLVGFLQPNLIEAL